MEIIFKIIILISLSLRIHSFDIEIVSSGLSNIKRNDVLMRFYITLKHHGGISRSVFAHMIECCENLNDDDDVDCDSFRIHEDYIKISPGMSQNLTLIHPNIYVYNRKGYCLISIWHKILKENDEEKPMQIHARIVFDTTLKSAAEEVPTFLKDYYNPVTLIRCETEDLDPFENCAPVNCYIKYSGFRNYFDPKTKKCKKVPICSGDPTKELADVAYVPNSNTCRDLENMVTENDIEELTNGITKKSHPQPTNPVHVFCLHGIIDPKTGICVCDYGWKSEPFEPENGAVYRMCTLQCHSDNIVFPLIPFIIGLLSAFWMLLCVCFCEKYHFACNFMKKVSNTSQANCSCPPYSDNLGLTNR